MTTSITPTVHLARVYDLLIGAYGVPINRPDYDPLGGLVGTILSQHTSDINSDRAFDAPTHLLAEAIRSGGLANIKAVRIQDALLTLTEEQLKEGGTKTLSDYCMTN